MTSGKPTLINRSPAERLRCPMERLLASSHQPTRPSLRQRRELPWRQTRLLVAMGDCQGLELHSGISALDARAAVARAIATWNAIGLPIEIVLVGDALLGDATTELGLEQSPDVLVQWYISGNDPESLLIGAVHAHADYPSGNTLFGGPPLPLHFNASVLWGIESAGCYDIETIALHELAHLLGLIYHSGPETILYDAIPPAPAGIQHYLDSETIHRAQNLYASVPH